MGGMESGLNLVVAPQLDVVHGMGPARVKRLCLMQCGHSPGACWAILTTQTCQTDRRLSVSFVGGDITYLF